VHNVAKRSPKNEHKPVLRQAYVHSSCVKIETTVLLFRKITLRHCERPSPSPSPSLSWNGQVVWTDN